MWTGPKPTAICNPAPCDIANSDQQAGKCRCLDGYDGKIEWFADRAVGLCLPAVCDVQHSNQAAGRACACKDGYTGTITWSGKKPQGVCVPAPCDIANSTKEAGPLCKCADGFTGAITWDKDVPSGKCKPCTVPGREMRLTLDAFTCFEGTQCADYLDGAGVTDSEEDAHAACNADDACTGYDFSNGKGRLCKMAEDAYPGMVKDDTYKLCCKHDPTVMRFDSGQTWGKLG